MASRYNQTLRATWATQPLQWPQLANEASHNSFGPLLYDAVQHHPAIPGEVQKQLRQLYLNTALANTLALHELATILQALAQANIPVIVLKGAALAQASYGNVALRPMHDLDLLLPFAHIPQALSIVATLGFQLLEPIPFGDRSGLFWNELLLVKEGHKPVYLEFHWHLLDNPYYASRPGTPELFERSLPLQLEGQPARILAPDDFLLHLCSHSWHHHSGLWPQAGADIAQLLVQNGPTFNWERFLAHAQQYDLAYAVQTTLSQVVTQWHCPLPAGTWQAIQALRPGRKERFFIYCQQNKYLKPLRTIIALPSLQLRLAYLWGILFPSADYMARHYPSPKPLRMAYLHRFLCWGKLLFGD